MADKVKAKGLSGIVLNLNTGYPVFRVYRPEADSDGNDKYTDYKIEVDDLRVMITDKRALIKTDGDVKAITYNIPDRLKR